jgi:hypothetical protein
MSIDSNDNEVTETIVAEDIEGYMDKQRLKSLFDARNKAAESIRDASLNRLKAQERGASHELAQSIVNDRIASCVRAYIAECEPLLRNTETGRKLLYDEEVATFSVPYQKGGKTFTEILDLPAGEADGRTITLHGLDQYLRFNHATVKYGRASFEQNKGGFEPEPALTKNIPMPVRLSESIFRELNDLLAQLDIGLSAETNDDESVDFDYSDLI